MALTLGAGQVSLTPTQTQVVTPGSYISNFDFLSFRPRTVILVKNDTPFTLIKIVQDAF